MRGSDQRRTASIVLTGALLATALACANGSGRGGNAPPPYDPATEVTLQGTVEEVKQQSRPDGRETMRLALAIEGGTIEVILGPTNFVKKKGLEPAKGDRLEVTGSKVNHRGSVVLLAREVKMGDRSFTLRKPDGAIEGAEKKNR